VFFRDAKHDSIPDGREYGHLDLCWRERRFDEPYLFGEPEECLCTDRNADSRRFERLVWRFDNAYLDDDECDFMHLGWRVHSAHRRFIRQRLDRSALQSFDDIPVRFMYRSGRHHSESGKRDGDG
jgi:hypothetical protein